MHHRAMHDGRHALRSRSVLAAAVAIALAVVGACGTSTGAGGGASSGSSEGQSSPAGTTSDGTSADGMSTGDTSTSGTADEAPSSSPDGGHTTLVFWHYFTDRADLMDKLAQEYQQQTGVEVQMDLISSGDTLGQKFQAAAQAKTLPDITASWTGIGDKLAPYAKEGLVMNLQDELTTSSWKDNFTTAEIDTSSFPAGNTYGVDPGMYLVPIDSNNMQFLYNKDLFQRAGIASPPTTFAEFIAAGKKLKSIGVAPFVAGFGSWPLDSFAQVYLWNMIGQKDLEATYNGTMQYTDKPWVDFLSMFEQLRDSGILADGILADDDPAAESLFVSGQAGMIFDGSWALGVFNQQNPDFKNYGVFFPPSNGSFPVLIPGGVGASAFVVGTSPNKDAAVKFLQWLTDAPQQATYANSSFNLPANPAAAKQQVLTENLKSFSDKMDALIPALPTGMSGAVDTTMVKAIQQILAGKETAVEAAAAMQKAQATDQAQ